MRAVHLAVGWLIVGGFGVLWLWALVAWIARRPDVPRTFWAVLAVVQVSIAVQTIAGLVLILAGSRLGLLHYGYGSLFPLIVLVGGHVAARELADERAPYKVFGFAAFIIFGLTLRALTTGLGIG